MRSSMSVCTFLHLHKRHIYSICAPGGKYDSFSAFLLVGPGLEGVVFPVGGEGTCVSAWVTLLLRSALLFAALFFPRHGLPFLSVHNFPAAASDFSPLRSVNIMCSFSTYRLYHIRRVYSSRKGGFSGTFQLLQRLKVRLTVCGGNVILSVLKPMTRRRRRGGTNMPKNRRAAALILALCLLTACSAPRPGAGGAGEGGE